MNNGVPFDVAFSLDDATRLGWAVQFGTMEGGTFNWNTMAWEDR